MGLTDSAQRDAREAVQTLLGYIRLVDNRDPTVCTAYLDANVVHALTGKSGHAGTAACQAAIVHTRVPPRLVRIEKVQLERHLALIAAVVGAGRIQMALLFRMVSQGDRYVIDSASALLPKRRR